MGSSSNSQNLLGQNLKRLRASLKLSQLKLAERCELSTNFISELEGGKAWVSAETLDRIAATLCVAPHVLFQPLAPPESPNVDEVLSRCIIILENSGSRAITEIQKELQKLRD